MSLLNLFPSIRLIVYAALFVFLCNIVILITQWIGWLLHGEVLLFTSNRDGDDDIYLLDLRRGLTVRLLNTDVDEGALRWSPDGTRIVYTAPYHTMQIRVLNLQDSSELEVSVPSGDNMLPVWSPDGTQIAFSSGRSRAGFLSITIVDAETGEVGRRLSMPSAEDRVSAWHGDQLLYSAIADGTWAIFRMNEDGTDRRVVVNLVGGDFGAVWSPDGTQIAFTSFTDTVNQVYIMDADGSSARQLTYNMGGSAFPVWSPDGQRILYTVSIDFRTRELYIMDADGQNHRRLTYNDDDDVGFGWMPYE